MHDWYDILLKSAVVRDVHCLQKDISDVEIIHLFTKVSDFLSDQLNAWWKFVDHHPIWLDALVLYNDSYPTIVRKVYRTLSENNIKNYYELMEKFLDWLNTKAPDHRLLYWWFREDFQFSLGKIALPYWDWGIDEYRLDKHIIYNSVHIQKIEGDVLQNEIIGSQFDYLFDLFVKDRYGWDIAQKVFFPFKSKNTPLKVFQYPNLRKMEDGTIVLLDVNRIQHVVRTLEKK